MGIGSLYNYPSRKTGSSRSRSVEWMCDPEGRLSIALVTGNDLDKEFLRFMRLSGAETVVSMDTGEIHSCL